MKVLIVGATGNVGLRLVPALLTHGHNVVAYVRSAKKLELLLPEPVYRQLSVVEGDATDSAAIKRAILDFQCEAVVNSAGVAAVAPWGKSTLPEIFRAVLEGVQEAGAEQKSPLRVWFLGGLGVLQFPGAMSMISDYVPIFLAHRQNIQLLRSLSPNTVDWSMICPSTMTPESSDFSVPTKSSHARLTAGAGTPPLWQDSWLKHIPLVGKPIVAAMNANRYDTTLEQCADFIAADLETRDSQWIGAPVGIIDASK
ncbi:NAD(P)-binding protein [Bimuria novae-zelandiae CBS 107.79]|uniref:NAD(P)-binding protein n=1 Tax=Bimuria novae-zelandiae CBS 107.79 TaxID=1447943 RepID=A0A6A5UXM7_9PLEO|nr:NAD(P)-binding protein [Bimuria novae-zelandiae CBS 107.79]